VAVASASQLDRRRDLSLWYGVLAPPGAWVFEHEASVFLTPWVCRTGNHWILLLVALLGLGGAISGGLVAWRHFQPTPPEELERGPAPEFRRRFMAGAGLLLSTLFLLGAVALAVPIVLPLPCR
jgi:hypothetical protein